jgi:hypothetical protein
MTDVRIRGLNDEVIHLLKDQARRQGKPWQGFLHDALTEAAMRPRRELADQLREFQKQMRDKYGELPDSTPDIRAWRDGLE